MKAPGVVPTVSEGARRRHPLSPPRLVLVEPLRGSIDTAPAVPFVVTVWPSKWAPAAGKLVSSTWRAFLDGIVSRPYITIKKDALPCWAPIQYESNRRSLATAERVFAIVVDADGGARVPDAQRMWHRTIGCAHTTWSHDPSAGKLRLRLVLLLARPVELAEYGAIWDHVAARCSAAGWVVDASSRSLAQPNYRPARRPESAYEWATWGDRALDVDQILRASGASADLSGEKGCRRRAPSKPSRPSSARGCHPTTAGTPAALSYFGRAATIAGIVRHERRGGVLVIRCPWADQHTSAGDDAVILPPAGDAKWGLYTCRHEHCRRRRTLDLLDVLPAAALERARREHGSGLIRGRIAHAWINHLPPRDGMRALDRLVVWARPIDEEWARNHCTRVVITAARGTATHRALGGPVDDDAARVLVGKLVDVARDRSGNVTWAALATGRTT